MKKIIFDTDLGGDCDDVMALDLLLACEKMGECSLIGVTYSADAKNSVPCIHAILKQHGRGDVPIGHAPIADGITALSDNYATQVAQAFAAPDNLMYEDTEDAVHLLRRLLAANQPVTLCVTGFLTNIAALLLSPPDDISPLGGTQLVSGRVSELVIMGCSFQNAFPEWNIKCDIPAAQTVMSQCPVPVIICPFEVGLNMITGAAMAARGGRNAPDSLSYIVHGSINGRDSWDPATALYAVRGSDRYFEISGAGQCKIDNEGISCFSECGEGLHRYLRCALPQAEIAAEIDRIVTVL